MNITPEQIEAALLAMDRIAKSFPHGNAAILASAYRTKCGECDEMQKELRHYEIKLHESGSL